MPLQSTIQTHDHQAELEKNIREEAEWFGKTGLVEKDERELSKYLRRELGEQVQDENSLKAGDLQYQGSLKEGLCTVHYWHLPNHNETYAYIEVDNDGTTMMGWGDRIPPPGNL